jgi:outer membrane autotransporter protein
MNWKMMRLPALGLAGVMSVMVTTGSAFASAGCDVIANDDYAFGTGNGNKKMSDPDEQSSTGSYATFPTWDQFLPGNIIKIGTSYNSITWTNLEPTQIINGEYIVTAADVARGNVKIDADWSGAISGSYLDWGCRTGTEPTTPPGGSSSLREIQLNATKVAAQQSAAALVSGLKAQASKRLDACQFDDTPWTKDQDANYCARREEDPVSAWGNMTWTGFTDGDDDQRQINAFGGVDYLLTPEFLLGIVAGYEYTDSQFDSLGGSLSGNGETVGAYGAWRMGTALRAEAGVTYSMLSYDIENASADADFDATRLITYGGLSSVMNLGEVRVDPSANVLMLWQDEDSYTDSQGVEYDDRSFESFRGDVGAEFSLPNLHAGDWSTVPYAGVYADYWWNDDSESLNDTVGILENWSARVTGGIDFTSPGENASFTLGGELGGLGDTTTWSAKAEARFAF